MVHSLSYDGDKRGMGGLTGDSWLIVSTSRISNSWEYLNVEIAADTKTELWLASTNPGKTTH